MLAQPIAASCEKVAKLGHEELGMIRVGHIQIAEFLSWWMGF
jgi:hypothetical protein